jgi:hypothetical protein
MFSKSSDIFMFERCNFKIQKKKEGTGRIVVRTSFGILNSFTLECSFSGSDKGLRVHYSVGHLILLGADFAKTIFGFLLAEYGNLNESENDIRLPRVELKAVIEAIQNGDNAFVESDR